MATYPFAEQVEVAGSQRATMLAVCLDLEGILVPEIWINVAERTGIEALRRTTRDEPDYDRLMRYRLEILDENGITIDDITSAIEAMEPLEGAIGFLDSLERRWPTLVLSDTFSQFARPMMGKLGNPTLLCHTLVIEDSGRISDWTIRLQDQKRRTVEALRSMNYEVIAVGDSYNDTSMLASASAGVLFRPPDNVVEEFPQYPVTRDYDGLTAAIGEAASTLGE
ncbi:MAG: bifunctional phosphoserine phosphatase/homoserine phosphotransferase ThrH [Candidatus Thalassarchaeaceae archaeon]|nr:bifunctional phosphoserine phosphatase/homoserine phosphotransferase ThrH [Candidatus Thalassarchaeaceae archaeon]